MFRVRGRRTDGISLFFAFREMTEETLSTTDAIADWQSNGSLENLSHASQHDERSLNEDETDILTNIAFLHISDDFIPI